MKRFANYQHPHSPEEHSKPFKTLLLSLTLISTLSHGTGLLSMITQAREEDTGFQSQLLTFQSDQMKAKLERYRLLPTANITMTKKRSTTPTTTATDTNTLAATYSMPLVNGNAYGLYKAAQIADQGIALDEKAARTKQTLDTATTYFQTLKTQAALATTKTKYHKYHN